MDIGLKIKKLRKEHGITQEQLAEYLNISPQAISKWENGTAMPDITLIPSLVTVFEISADVLLGIEIAGTNEREKAYEEEYRTLCKSGDVWGRCALMRKALAEFPRNYSFMSGLARSLFYCMKKDEDFSELVALCNRIINTCHDTELVCSAKETLVRAYAKHGDKFDEEIGKNLPYTSVFFDRLTFKDDGIVRHVDNSESSRTLRKLQRWDDFNFMRNSEEFKELENHLKEKAEKFKKQDI